MSTIDPTPDRDEIALSQEIFEASPAFCVVIDASGKTIKMNRTMLERLGYAREEVIGRDYMSMFVPERDHAALAAVFAKLSRNGEATLNENHVLTRDGREILVEWHGRPIFDPEGELTRFFGVGILVGERHRMEEALQRSEQRLELHVQQTPLAVIEWDVAGLVTAWNPAAERIFGYSREEAEGRLITDDILPVSTRAHVAVVWQGLLDQKGGTRSTNENVTKDGRVIFCDWYNTPLVGPGGVVIGVASLVNDITDQRRTEEELRRRDREQAETIQRLSAPVIDVWDGVLALPVIGAVDAVRAGRMTEQLLGAIVRSRASFTIVDVTGVSEMDASSANHLMEMVRAAQLLGTQCLISGISPAVAQSLVQLGVDLGDLMTFGTLRAALGHALGQAAARARR